MSHEEIKVALVLLGFKEPILKMETGVWELWKDPVSVFRPAELEYIIDMNIHRYDSDIIYATNKTIIPLLMEVLRGRDGSEDSPVITGV